MKELKEYAQLSNWLPTNGDQFRLYELAVAGASREGAREILDLSSNHFNVVYKNLKDNFVNGVLSGSIKSESKVTKLHHGIRKQYTTAMLLLRSDKKAAGIPLARATMRKAEKYGLNQIALDLSRELRSYYGPTSPNKKLYEYYTQKQKYLINEVMNELKAEDVFYDLGFSLNKGMPIEDFKKKIEGLASLSVDSYRFHYMRWLAKVLFWQHSGKEREMLEACRAALKFFESYDDVPYVIKFSFYYRAISVLISRKDFYQAEMLINRGLEETATGRHNWQIIMLNRALLGFHSEKPAIAFSAWNKSTQVPKKHLTEAIQQRWMIVESYLALMDFELPKKFRLGRFLNSVPLMESDKSGQNVNVVILGLMHLLKAQKLREYDDRIDQMDKYIHQHLRGKNRNRSIHFLRMLQCVQRGGYHRVAVERKAQSYIANLEKTTPSISANAVELVPFMVLWKMLLDWLK
ncbi:MAG: hypothetical protein AAFZ15_02920 [Bacteroidota bacterium]